MTSQPTPQIGSLKHLCSKQPYSKPELIVYGPMEQITQNGGSGGIDGIIGIDIDGDGDIDIGTGVTTGSL